MGYYLTTNIIKQAYYELSNTNYSNQSILHIFLILKGIGVNSLTYNNIDIIKLRGLEYAQDISGLFSDFECKPEKCDFINPFMMKTWGTNPTELLKKWVDSRVKNNIIGGATTWRKIIMQNNDGDFKFVYNYIDEIKKITMENSEKIPLVPMAIWANRFTEFDEKISLNKLCDYFLDRFKFSSLEKGQLFTLNSAQNELEFTNELYDTASIRQLIGNPPGMNNWIDSIRNVDYIDISKTIMRRYKMEKMNVVEKELLKKLLEDYNQLIISGPPGTSKSYLCDCLSKDYSECIHIQFHPQYSYQQFIGGYIVDKTDVNYHKGIMLQLIDKAIESKKNNEQKKYLVVIDEINRANTSQVFGELIQCLDRNNRVEILCDNKPVEYYIPDNIHIVGTMNSTDRTIGSLDYALKRRFVEVYCPSNPSILMDLCPNNSFISLSEFLDRINQKLYETLNNREMCIGHAIFLNSKYKNDENKYIWDFEKFELLFNCKILPTIEEYCYGNIEMINEIIGESLARRLSGQEFKEAIEEFLK